MKCKTCKWWNVDVLTPREARRQAQPEDGFCKRFPPTPWNFKTWWPIVNPNDWCGEWEPKDE